MCKLIVFASLFALGCGASSQGNSGPDSHTEGPTPGHHEHAKHHDDDAHQHRFDKAEEWVSRFEGPERDAWQKPSLVVASMNIKSGMHIADVGAGTGYFLPSLSRAVGDTGRVIGLDVEADMVRYMNERVAKEGMSNASARQCPFDAPGLEAGSVDRILIVDTWHHIAARGEYSAKLAEALKPGGEVYIVDFTEASPHGPPVKHRLQPPAVIAELRAGGLAAEVISVELPYQWVVRARK